MSEQDKGEVVHLPDVYKLTELLIRQERGYQRAGMSTTSKDRAELFVQYVLKHGGMKDPAA